MKGSAKQKVPGGKLLSVKIEYNDEIESVQILGDFFLHPEESLGKIEDSIKKIKTSESAEKIAERVRKIVTEEGIEMIGVTPEAIGNVVKLAMVQWDGG